MSEFMYDKEKYIEEHEQIIFENNTDSSFGVETGIIFHKSGLYDVDINNNHVVVSKVNERKAIDEAYQKGFEAGQHEATTLEYQQGLDDAWECARHLFSEASDTEINLIFPQEWNNGGFKALMALHPQDAIDRIKAYEEQQKADGIKVGDEVCFVFAGGETIEPFIVFSIKDDNGKKYYEGIQTSDGRWVSGGLKYYKTGRHFPQVAELFKAMKEGTE